MNKIKMYIDKDGTKTYINSKGKYHRLDGPAIEWSDGTKCWYKKGLRHREEGPAIEFTNGDKYWYKKNKWHRTNGPALECVNGNKEWYILDEELEEKEFNSWNLRIKIFI